MPRINKWLRHFTLIVIANLLSSLNGQNDSTPQCGFDNSPESDNYDGSYSIKAFPWLGALHYPYKGNRLTTAVVLVTKQIVLASALELDKMPKKNFRARAKVLLGQNCSMPGIPIREYIYHPEFRNSTINTLALIQLDLDHVTQDLMPICPPAEYMIKPVFYAMRLHTGTSCIEPLVNVYKMEYVSLEDCHSYYRRSGLEMAALWPQHPACGKALRGGECLWYGGTALAVRHYGKWRLMAFGLHGPGCEAPSKFVDYWMYHSWVRKTVRTPGRTTLTRIGSSHMVLRRSLSHVRRFGPCDEEEVTYEIYSDKTSVHPDFEKVGKATYNLTLMDTVEYSCVVLRAYSYKNYTEPRIRLRRWCASASSFCYDQQYIEIQFHVIINFQGPTAYEVKAYGRQIRTMDPMAAMKYVNRYALHPKLLRYSDFEDLFDMDRGYGSWVPGWRYGRYKGFKIRRYEVYEHCMGNVSFLEKRFCGQYEFTIVPGRWFSYKKTKTQKEEILPFNPRFHFVWRYVGQREKLQYPIDGYEPIIEPESQDRYNENIERQYAHGWHDGWLYEPRNYIYFIYGHEYRIRKKPKKPPGGKLK